MIAVRLMGGLGNQLFQFATGRRLALRHGVGLVLDLGWFSHEAAAFATPRRYELDGLALNVRTIELTPRELESIETGGRRRRRNHTFQVLRQRDGDYTVDDRVLRADDNVLLVGYWQSEAYFADVARAIHDELRDLTGSPTQDASAPRLVESPQAVAVHVRRGDYVANPQTLRFHGVLELDYYRHALEHVAERVPDPVFVAFSDDPEWVEQELAAELGLTVVRGGDALTELGLMSRCAHHVIANSSFSWWGAWLGERDGSVIVAPQRWFADPTADTHFLVPERWRRL